jgi:hypothetical protein
MKCNYSNCTLCTSRIRLFADSIAGRGWRGAHSPDTATSTACCHRRLARCGAIAPVDGQRPDCCLAASSLHLRSGIPCVSGDEESQRQVKLDGGMYGWSRPIKQKESIRRSSSTHIMVRMAQYYFSSSLHPAPSSSAQNVGVGAPMAAGDKTVEDLMVLVKKSRYGSCHSLPYRVIRPCI